MKNMKGGVAVVTGGGSGLGKAIAQEAARRGMRVVIADVQAEAMNAAVKELRASGADAIGVLTDVTSAASVEALAEAAERQFGPANLVFNNAGVNAPAVPLDELTFEQWRNVIDTNLNGVFLCARGAFGLMRRQQPQGGRIINIGSTNAERMPFAGGGPYAMSKSALVGLTRGLARDLGPQGITINNVQPGPVDTDMNPASGEFADSLMGYMAVGRYGRVEEIASFVAYLAGPEAAYITGASLTIDGGFAA